MLLVLNVAACQLEEDLPLPCPLCIAQAAAQRSAPVLPRRM